MHGGLFCGFCGSFFFLIYSFGFSAVHLTTYIYTVRDTENLTFPSDYRADFLCISMRCSVVVRTDNSDSVRTISQFYGIRVYRIIGHGISAI